MAVVEPVRFSLERKGTEIDLHIATRTEGVSEEEVVALIHDLLQLTRKWSGAGSDEFDVDQGHTGLAGAKWQVGIRSGPYLLYSREGQL